MPTMSCPIRPDEGTMTTWPVNEVDSEVVALEGDLLRRHRVEALGRELELEVEDTNSNSNLKARQAASPTLTLPSS